MADLLVTIADETRRLSRLVRSMLDMSRVESTGEDLTRRREFDISDRIVSTMLSFEAVSYTHLTLPTILLV